MRFLDPRCTSGETTPCEHIRRGATLVLLDLGGLGSHITYPIATGMDSPPNGMPWTTSKYVTESSRNQSACRTGRQALVSRHPSFRQRRGKEGMRGRHAGENLTHYSFSFYVPTRPKGAASKPFLPTRTTLNPAISEKKNRTPQKPISPASAAAAGSEGGNAV